MEATSFSLFQHSFQNAVLPSKYKLLRVQQMPHLHRLGANFIQRVYRNGLFTDDCIFQHLTNVNYIDLQDEDRVQRVHCKSCNLALGFKYVRVPAAQLCFLVLNERRSKLNLERLSYWNGNQIVSGYEAVLPEPIPGPEPVFQLVPEPPLPAGDLDQLQAVIGNNVIVHQPQPPDPPRGNDDEPPVTGRG